MHLRSVLNKLASCAYNQLIFTHKFLVKFDFPLFEIHYHISAKKRTVENQI